MGMGGRPTGMGLLLARPSLLYYPPLFQDDSLESPGSSEFLPPVRNGCPPLRLGTARRILPEAAPAQCGGRRIGSAIVLLLLLACCSLLLPAPTLARRTRWVLGILSLLAGAVLLQTAPAQAQARSVNVSNINQTSTDQSFAGATLRCIATVFTTGGAGTDRYTLNTVVVAFGSGNTDSPTATITNPGTGSNSINPGTLIANLNGTVPSGGGNVTFTAPNGTTLNGGATYFLDVCASLGNTTVHKVTTSDAQESTSTTG